MMDGEEQANAGEGREGGGERESPLYNLLRIAATSASSRGFTLGGKKLVTSP